MDPSDWNIVVLGAWNRAILTPAWIGGIVLGLPVDSPLEVMVPLDASTTFQVRHQGLVVVPGPGQLVIQVEEPTADVLDRGMTAMKKAMEDLPRTPLRACGINLRFSSAEAPAALLDRTRCKTEQLLSEQGYEIRIRRRGETLVFGQGSLNILVDIPTAGNCTVTLNFEQQSAARDAIVAWLARPAAEYIAEAEKILGVISH